jgi:hypothetical protein
MQGYILVSDSIRGWSVCLAPDTRDSCLTVGVPLKDAVAYLIFISIPARLPYRCPV